MTTNATTRVRMMLIFLIVWVVVFFNIERSEFLAINIPSTLYIYSAIWLLLMLLLSSTGQVRSEYSLLLALPIYAGLRYFHILSNVEFTVPGLIVECSILSATIWFGQRVSSNLENLQMVVDEIIYDNKSGRIQSMNEGEDAVNKELFRARKYERPVAILYIKMPSVGRLHNQYPNALNYQLGLEHRYIQTRIARIAESLLYQVDLMVWYGNDLVICLPETDHNQATKLIKQISQTVYRALNVEFQAGIATFPEDGLIYNDLVTTAEANRKIHRNSEDDYEDDLGDSEKIIETFPTLLDAVKLEPETESLPIIASMAHSVKARWQSLFGDIRIVPHEMFSEQSPNMEYLYHDPDYWVNRLPEQSASSRWIYNYIKRVMDLTIILIATPILLPLVGIAALLVWVEGGRPIFYSQYRTGLGGRKFKMYKFRSMVRDADKRLTEMGITVNERNETVNEYGEKLSHDPRITRIGRILRRTSIDELPQLWNVFKGDMSLVGPRPTSFGVDKYQLYHTHRLSVKPGLTGLWQIHDRGDTDFDNRLVWDIKYIEKLSLAMDIQIILHTAAAVLRKQGAR